MQAIGNKFPNIKERILYLLECKGIVKDKFFQKIGMTYGNFTGKAKETPLNSTAIGNILLEIPDVNLEWLILERGNMLKAREQPAITTDSLPNNEKMDNEYLLKYVKKLEYENEKKQELIDGFLSGAIVVDKKEPPDTSVSYQSTG